VYLYRAFGERPYEFSMQSSIADITNYNPASRATTGRPYDFPNTDGANLRAFGERPYDFPNTYYSNMWESPPPPLLNFH